jgi:hypothetical protein
MSRANPEEAILELLVDAYLRASPLRQRDDRPHRPERIVGKLANDFLRRWKRRFRWRISVSRRASVNRRFIGLRYCLWRDAARLGGCNTDRKQAEKKCIYAWFSCQPGRCRLIPAIEGLTRVPMPMRYLTPAEMLRHLRLSPQYLDSDMAGRPGCLRIRFTLAVGSIRLKRATASL